MYRWSACFCSRTTSLVTSRKYALVVPNLFLTPLWKVKRRNKTSVLFSNCCICTTWQRRLTIPPLNQPHDFQKSSFFAGELSYIIIPAVTANNLIRMVYYASTVIFCPTTRSVASNQSQERYLSRERRRSYRVGE